MVILLGVNSSAFASDPEGDSQESADTNAIASVMHHIGDANEFHIIGDITLPLPTITYDSQNGLLFGMSNQFSHKVKNGYTIYHGNLYRLANVDSAKLNETIPGFEYANKSVHSTSKDEKAFLETVRKYQSAGLSMDTSHEGYVLEHDHQLYHLVPASHIMHMSSWQDFSITKNVFSLFLAFFILLFIFTKVKKGYVVRKNQSPKGMQSFFEVLIVFLRDDVVKPSIGPKWEKYFPFICSLFFFILVINLLGLVPFFPGSGNVTGNLGITIVLALFTFLVTNFSGNKHYWGHIFNMPGVPKAILIILTPIELIGLIVKPFTLLVRLFANITAGHIIVLSLISLIFILGDYGQSTGGMIGGTALSIPFVFALNLLELFVAFLQAFIFALLSSLYIGAAVEEHHHEEAH